MKFILISVLLGFSSFSTTSDVCDDLKFDIEVTHTTDGLNNGKIDVTITKGLQNVKAFLYAKSRGNNRLNIKIDELKNLPSGTFTLVLQNKNCSSVKSDIIIK